MTMIEKVARAIWLRSRPTMADWWPQYLSEYESRVREGRDDNTVADAFKDARAALLSLKEVDEGTLGAMANALLSDSDLEFGQATVAGDLLVPLEGAWRLALSRMAEEQR